MQVDVETIGSSFGGGWALPRTDAGREALAEFYNDEPAPLAPLGGDVGYIVEPQEAGDLMAWLEATGARYAPQGSI